MTTALEEKKEAIVPAVGKLDVSVVLPAWNEAENVRRIVPQLRRVLEKGRVSYEITVVVPNAEDPTIAACRDLGVTALVQKDPGYGGALKTGFEAARGEFILTLDADCSHDPSAVLSMLDARERADVVVGSRYVRFGHSQAGRFRDSLSRVLNGFFRGLLDVPVMDMTSGFRLYRRRVFDEVKTWGRDFDALPEILVLAFTLGFSVVEVPFHYRPRAAGASHARVVKFGIRYLRLAWRLWWLRYSYFSADYDQRAFYSRIPLQRYWQRKRYEIILGFLEQGPAVLDIGCGTSMVIMALPEAVGLEVAFKKLRFLRQVGRRLTAGVLARLPFKSGQFDQVICSEVIEHIPLAEISFAEMRRVLKPGGVLVIGTPDYGTWVWPFIEWCYKRVMPGGYSDEHVTHFTEQSLRESLEKAGFEVVKARWILRGEMIMKARARA
ncbi:MAG TPA: glycosyltransferase [Planctomycetota bacterium]|nr:glycosyltransferase [Planctomycetota bacterium]